MHEAEFQVSVKNGTNLGNYVYAFRVPLHFVSYVHIYFLLFSFWFYFQF